MAVNTHLHSDVAHGKEIAVFLIVMGMARNLNQAQWHDFLRYFIEAPGQIGRKRNFSAHTIKSNSMSSLKNASRLTLISESMIPSLFEALFPLFKILEGDHPHSIMVGAGGLNVSLHETGGNPRIACLQAESVAIQSCHFQV
jgi:hypothetical protein